MDNEEFRVLLDEVEPIKRRGFESEGRFLRGAPIYNLSNPGMGGQLEALLVERLKPVPSFMLIKGRTFAKREEDFKEYYSCYAERLVVWDVDGILPGPGSAYVIDIQNGGLFAWDTERIKDAVLNNKLKDGTMPLDQDEVNQLLSAIYGGRLDLLESMLHGGKVIFAGTYDQFCTESANSLFQAKLGIDSTYVVVRDINSANSVIQRESIEIQRTNPDIVIASGGMDMAQDLLDTAHRFRLRTIGSSHDDYRNFLNSGCIVLLRGLEGGISGQGNLKSSTPFVGVDPEAVKEFYAKK